MRWLPAIVSLILPLAVASLAIGGEITDLTSWAIEGDVRMDAARPGPGGAPSIRLAPGGRATLKLRDADGSGKVSLCVYDDGAVASTGGAKSVGPRWGTGESDGRVLVGAIMYAPFLQPEGSVCLIDTSPKEKQAWLAMKFLSPRGAPGWKKWEFNFDPEAGLKLTVDGKPVTQRHFDWNASRASGFNGLVLFGDESPAATAQTVWISDVSVDLGPPMNVKPGSLPPPPPPPLPEAKGPAPEELTDKSGEPPVIATMEGFVPGPTLLHDLKNLSIPLVEGYASQHPRLLFSAGDLAALQKRALERPDLWSAVLTNAAWLTSPERIPSATDVRSGGKYWRIEKVQSGSLAWFVTGDAAYRDGAVRWMVAHAREGVWGDVYRPNLDLVASWYLYHIAVGYDILKGEMSEADRSAIRDGLAAHARAIYLAHDPYNTEEKLRYDQNHTYIPIVALTAAALALLEEVPEAKHWLVRSYAVLRRCRYVLSEDGYYYEGVGYWTYALNWHVRGAELIGRATGEKLFDLPALRDTWRFGLYLSLPGTPGAFGVGDCGSWTDDKLADPRFNNAAMLWKVAVETGSGRSRTVGDLYFGRQPERDYPATAFLWASPGGEAVAMETIEPWHYFPDQDVVAWRSGWGPDATCYLFRCGPPLGHKAAAKLGQLSDWVMNAGHVHPDIGGFWMFAKGAYLAVDTGYTAEKWTRDHNTLLVDDKGQGMDGSYHNERGIRYADLDQARITSQFLGADYGYASGEFGAAYRRLAPGVSLRRSVLMTQRWMLIVDDMEAEQPRRLTWLCHSAAEFQPDGAAFVARQPLASLAVVPLSTVKADAKPEPTMVMAGTAPGRGVATQRGFTLGLRSPEAVSKTRFINLLLPLAPGEGVPLVEPVRDENNALSLRIKWADGKTQAVRLDLGWAVGGEVGPATIKME